MPRLSKIRQEAVADAVRQSICDATVRVLCEHGLAELSMNRVATEAGLAKATLYHYFPGKRKLLQFVHTSLIYPLEEDLAEVVSCGEYDARMKLEQCLSHILEWVQSHKQFFQALCQEESLQRWLRVSLRSHREVLIELLSPVFRQGMAEGVFRSGNEGLMAAMFLGMLQGAVLWTRNQPEVDLRVVLYKSLLESFLDGVAAAGKDSASQRHP